MHINSTVYSCDKRPDHNLCEEMVVTEDMIETAYITNFAEQCESNYIGAPEPCPADMRLDSCKVHGVEVIGYIDPKYGVLPKQLEMSKMTCEQIIQGLYTRYVP